MNFYRVLSVSSIVLSVFFSDALSANDDTEGSDNSSPTTISRRVPRAYDSVIELCKDTVRVNNADEDALSVYGDEEEVVRDYTTAVEACHISDYRKSGWGIWGLRICNLFSHKDYMKRIQIELHHIAGDILFVAKMLDNPEFLSKTVQSAVEHKYQEIWFEENARSLTSRVDMDRLIIPPLPEKNKITSRELRTALTKMISIFQQWDVLEKDLTTTPDALKTFYLGKILREYTALTYSDDAYIPYSLAGLHRYRAMRHLNFIGHPRKFNREQHYLYQTKLLEEWHKLYNSGPF